MNWKGKATKTRCALLRKTHKARDVVKCSAITPFSTLQPNQTFSILHSQYTNPIRLKGSVILNEITRKLCHPYMFTSTFPANVCVRNACILCARARVCEGGESFSFNTSETERHSVIREWNLKRLSVSILAPPLSPSLSVSLTFTLCLFLPLSLCLSPSVYLSLPVLSHFFGGGGVLIHHPIITRFYHTSGRTMSGDILYSLWLSTNVYVCRRCLCGQSLRHKHFRYQQRSHTHPVTCSFIMAALLPAADNTR